MAKQQHYHFPSLPASYRPNLWDLMIFVLIFSLFVLLAQSAAKMAMPYHLGEILPINLDPSALPEYALRTVLRMFFAMILSLLFSLGAGLLAAKSRYAERIIIPAIDILQSIPILGYLSITVVGFIWLFPNSLLGPECAAIFAIFTSQAWNTALSVYQSIKTVPLDLCEAADIYRLSPWQRFWRLEMPYATPPLLWNMMMSMSAGWFFVVAAEAITVSNQQIYLPGIGSYIGAAINEANIQAVFYAILAMFIVIIIYDQIIFRPLIKWSEKFKTDENTMEHAASSWVYSMFTRSRLFQKFGIGLSIISDALINMPIFIRQKESYKTEKLQRSSSIFFTFLGIAAPLSVILIGFYGMSHYILETISYQEISYVFQLGGVTALRVFSLVIISSIIWVPIGVWIGMRPRIRQIVQPIAQFMAAFPANLLFPIFVIYIVKYHLDVNIWSSPLMIIGTQWYILFNVIAGAASIPGDLYDMSENFGLKGWLWWKRLALPAIAPLYVTGALTAAGGAWNASIVAEVISWGNTKLVATGLGAYITEYTTSGDFHRILLGIGVMSIYVVTFNILFWQRLYTYTQKRFRGN